VIALPLLALWLAPPSFAAPARAEPPGLERALSPVERERLRYKLENLYDEVDLMIRNRDSDVADVHHQERDFRELRAFDRIPLAGSAEDSVAALQTELAANARLYGLRLLRLSLVGRARRPAPVPKAILTSSNFRLSAEQVAEALELELRVSGDPARVAAWTKSWREELLRVVEPEGELTKGAEGRLAKGAEGRLAKGAETQEPPTLKIRARAYRFRDIRFPRLSPRDPLTLLPAWARRDTKAFARAEPTLWRLVAGFQELAPKALPLYRVREDFLLNDARLSFFIRKTQAASP
jgi:hypothetical protein